MSTATDLGPSRSPFGPDAAARVPSSGTGLSSTGGRVAMLVVVILAVVAAFLGSGVVGGLTPVAEAAGGWLGPDATWVSPATPAFGIWSVIYAGLLAYAVWQFLASAQSARHDRLRPWILVSVLLNAAWIWTVQAGLLGLSVVVIALLLTCLAWILVLLESVRAHSWGSGSSWTGCRACIWAGSRSPPWRTWPRGWPRPASSAIRGSRPSGRR